MTKSPRNAPRSGKAWAVVDITSRRPLSSYHLFREKRLARKLRDKYWPKCRVIRVEIREVK